MRVTYLPRWACVAALLLLAACSDAPGLEGADLPFLRGLVDQVDSQRMLVDVARLLQLHRSDTPLDCTLWPDVEGSRALGFCDQTSAQAGAFMETRLRELGLRVERQVTHGRHFNTSNVIAELPGLTRPDELVIVGAHFDAFYGGSDDNSSSVAAILEMAHLLSQHRFDRSVLFVGFDLEELGAIGAHRFVSSLPAQRRVVAALNLDCIAYYDTRPGSQGSLPGIVAPSVGDFLALISNAPSDHLATQFHALSGVLQLSKVVPLIAPGEGTFPLMEPLLRSDHSTFWMAGYPALFATDTAPFRNPHYHRDTDTPETLHPELYRKAVQSSLAAVAYWAGGPR